VGKIIFWIVVVFVVLFGLRLMNAAKGNRRARDTVSGAKKSGAPAETMVKCDNCGVFLPRGDARPVAGGYVCGDPGCAARR
jgi:hypothetical protein